MSLLIAVAAVLLALSIVASGALGASGGIGTDAGSGGDPPAAGGGNSTPGKYKRLWTRVDGSQKRWARATSRCESGGDPDAIGSGGRYRGAFQFARSTWRTSPKSPGGDPIDFSYKTQAVVAVALKLRDGRRHWPVCG